MLSAILKLFRLKAKCPCCPVCQCNNYIETEFYGRIDQGIIGYDRNFACGFQMSWKGVRTHLCGAQQRPNNAVAQAIASLVPAAREVARMNGSAV